MSPISIQLLASLLSIFAYSSSDDEIPGLPWVQLISLVTYFPNCPECNQSPDYTDQLLCLDCYTRHSHGLCPLFHCGFAGQTPHPRASTIPTGMVSLDPNISVLRQTK